MRRKRAEISVCLLVTGLEWRPGTRFSKAPESFLVRKATFRSSVSKTGRCIRLKLVVWRELPFIFRIFEQNSSVIARFKILQWLYGLEKFPGLSRNGPLIFYQFQLMSGLVILECGFFKWWKWCRKNRIYQADIAISDSCRRTTHHTGSTDSGRKSNFRR